ncbi:MAG: globin-coupled sensor protein [Halohasta sp.]
MSSKNKIDGARRSEVDGQQLISEIGVDSEEILWRKDFTNFDRLDEQRLEAMGEAMEPHVDGMVDAFYDHLNGFDETVAIFGRSTKTVDQLKQSQRAYLQGLFDGEYDQGHFESRARIGKIHDMLDLGPKIYLGAYTVFYQRMVDALVSDLQGQLATKDTDEQTTETGLQPDEALAELGDRLLSILKITNLDQQVAMDTYINSYSQDLEAELDRQQEVTAEVRTAATESKKAGMEITESADAISEVATSQADSMKQVANEVSNMSATVEEIASTANDLAGRSEETDDLAREGTAAADEALSVMDSVADASEDVVDDMERLQSRIDDIDEVVEVINEIAEQTNLLALNASIEAARAGEAGSGFAVVADEVKGLAEESQTHASDIEQLVEEVQTDASETVESLEATSEEIDTGIAQVEAAMETFEEIAAGIQQASQGIREVSNATDDQATSSEEVSSMMTELVDQATQIADEIQDVAAANEQQTEQIQEIERTVERLT